MIYHNKTILITGGSGFLGKALTKYFYNKVKKIIIYSRNEYNQFLMQQKIKDKSDRIRYFIGDIRDKERLNRALKNVNYVIHAAALKRIEIGEYNPNEMILTNIIGTINILECSIDNGIEKAILISSDKSVNPSTLYGYTKAIAERLFQQYKIYSREHSFKTAVVRYGNVANSTGSVIPVFKNIKKEYLPVTNEKMSRFWFDIKDACKIIEFALHYGLDGEIFIPKLKSFRILDLIKAFDKDYEIIGIRGIEKLYEEMISKYEKVYDTGKYYCIPPSLEEIKNNLFTGFKKMPDGFEYNSRDNEFMTVQEIKEKLIDLE